ncbi:RNA polymerase sigma factor [Frateuria aurantia]
MSGPELSDQALVARALLNDDRHAFNTLVRRHQSALRLWLARLCHGDQAVADDLAQETFLQAWRRLGQFRGEAQFSTWLHSIGYRQFLMHQRRHPAERRSQAMDAVDLEQLQDQQPAVDHHFALERDLDRAMQVLSPHEYAAIMQCYVLDQPQEEAALVMGCAVGTVKSHVFRAKQKLRQALADWHTKEPS